MATAIFNRKHCTLCNKRFTPTNGRQVFCTAKCRRKVEHLRYIAKYPEQRKLRMDKLLEWKKENPLRAVRVKRRFFNTKQLPNWLLGI